ncbi:MAG TPA: hypothetical protein VFL12_03495 [Thermoanaerobaculia bacterium]|nr:hypothetical protein [Thermoanaerobaculia bacterium]
MPARKSPVPVFKPRISLRAIPDYARRYPEEVDAEVEKIGAEARRLGYLRRPAFLALCRWKTPRTAPLCESNPAALVRRVTSLAFATEDERIRIELLTLLQGVSWPTASAILHLCFPDRYPILDVRALWSLSVSPPRGFGWPFWSAYVDYSRKLARKAGVTMRTLDRALWTWSKEHES